MQLPVVTGVALTVVVAALAAVRNRFVRARLGFSGVLLLVALGLELALARGIGEAALVGGLARLLLVAGGLVAVVSLLFNPWRQNRVSERVPAIVQDVIVIACFALAGLCFAIYEKFSPSLEAPRARDAEPRLARRVGHLGVALGLDLVDQRAQRVRGERLGSADGHARRVAAGRAAARRWRRGCRWR